MNQEKINWDNDTKNAIHGLLNNIGVGEEQALRIVDDIEKSLDWNSELEMFSDDDVDPCDHFSDSMFYL